MVLACAPLAVYGLLGGREPLVIWILFLPFNAGFGLRGPPGFYCALQASGGDDARAAALVILYVMLVTAGATALLAPWVTLGLLPAALAATVLALVSLLLLMKLPALPDEGDGAGVDCSGSEGSTNAD